MKPIYTDGGIATQTWEFLETIESFANNTVFSNLTDMNLV
jgi:hypothetical protein